MLFIVPLLLFLWYLYCKLICGITKSARCLIGKTAIVTGGNSGLGFQVCLNLASRGCKVIIADKDDSDESRRRIIKTTENPNIFSKKLNLASFKSIRDFVDEIKADEDKLDILVNNAGIPGPSGVTTEDGLDLVMQVNYFGPFLLTYLLTNLLKQSAPSRIIFTSSILAFIGNLNLDRKNLGNISAYGNSKLATIVASDIFAKKLQNTGVTCNSLHPGFIFTKIFEHYSKCGPISRFNTIVAYILYVFSGKTVWEGAQTTTHLAVSEEVENVTGKYFADCRPHVKPPQAWNEKTCQQVWDTTEKYVRLLPHEKM